MNKLQLSNLWYHERKNIVNESHMSLTAQKSERGHLAENTLKKTQQLEQEEPLGEDTGSNHCLPTSGQ